ncbi:MAG TPA: dihydrofolate reductase [Flavobacteriales bacterium]|nr:dihydrofolate reductase [Flavobacteriales bacterium]
MKNLKLLFIPAAILALIFTSCGGGDGSQADNAEVDSTAVASEAEFNYLAEQFADIKLIRYQIPGWENLSAKQKELIYYLYEAGLSGRDMIWDQNYRHNLEIRKALETILTSEAANRASAEWETFETYAKRVFFSNGIHHHYSMAKIPAEFSAEFLDELLAATGAKLSDEAKKAILDPEFDAKKVNLDPNLGLIKGSAVNLYAPDITEDEVNAYYKALIDTNDTEPISYGLNSRMERDADGNLYENVYKSGGLYGAAIDKVAYWLSKAADVAENKAQGDALRLLVEYYKAGDLEKWDDYNIAWSSATEGDIDYIQGFVEVYNDPKGYRGSYESIVQIKDFEASDRMKVLMQNVQWFEDNSSIMDEHKKDTVKGVTYKVVNVAGEAGDASPSTPIGVNLPNANWIRAKHGSKSVSLGNIVHAYAQAPSSGFSEEFIRTEELRARSKEHGGLAGKLHTALHEVVGHASGKLNPGVGTPKETLGSYASTLEEGRADLVALYYLLDPKLVEFGLMPSTEVGMAEYDSYIRNGMMLQLRRIEAGESIEEAHMRNRQLVASWAYEKGMEENVIEKVVEDGKTFFEVRDYEKLRVIFGELLKEIQRVKSEGDYEAGQALVENYGVKVDKDLHEEVLARAEKLNSAPYGGFVNPRLVPVMEGDKISDIKVEYPEVFLDQMLEYGENYGFLNK